MSNKIFERLAATWPSSLVSRSEVGRFSGGLLNPRTLANLDCTGQGPAGRVRIGRKICYDVTSLIDWLESRTTQPDK